MSTRDELTTILKTAMSHEARLVDLYQDAIPTARSAAGQAFFQVMADEEQSHHAFLTHCLQRWQSSGILPQTIIEPSTTFVEFSRESLQRAHEGLFPSSAETSETKSSTTSNAHRSPESAADELDYLHRALALEAETSAFYHKLVAEADEEFRPLFEGFLTIENDHQAFVDFQIKMLTITGSYYELPVSHPEKSTS